MLTVVFVPQIFTYIQVAKYNRTNTLSSSFLFTRNEGETWNELNLVRLTLSFLSTYPFKDFTFHYSLNVRRSWTTISNVSPLWDEVFCRQKSQYTHYYNLKIYSFVFTATSANSTKHNRPWRKLHNPNHRRRYPCCCDRHALGGWPHGKLNENLHFNRPL